MTPEGKVQREIRDMLTSKGCLVLKMQIISKVGFPDLFCVYKGVPFFIEVKQPGKIPRKIQYKRLEQLTFDAGLIATWFDNVNDAELWFDYEILTRVDPNVSSARTVRENKCGGRHSHLTVLYPRRNSKNIWEWECLCDCGKFLVIRGQRLKEGNISCGCARRQRTPSQSAKDRATTKVYGSYRGRAKRSNKDFTIGFNEFSDMILSPCHYCGDSPSNSMIVSYANDTDYEFLYNGVDRVDNSLGYVDGNCVPCCNLCNTMKLDSTMDEFIEKCSIIAERWSI